MKRIKLFYFFCFAIIINDAHATIWQVGPSRPYPAPSAVASLVADGDTVDIDAGLYNGDVAKWFANNLLLRSVGGGFAHLDAGGNNAEGKAIWVIKGNDCTVEGIEFSGCQVPDHNGAGIRQEGKNLTLLHCYFHHNEMGILTSNDGVSDYMFMGCEFSENGYGDGYSHNIYVGHANSLTMQFCYSHDAHVGHLVKSRASANYLFFNRLSGENGDGSYEVDLPNGGTSLLFGNIIEQSANSQNGSMIAYGLEGATSPFQVLVLSHNTLVNDRFDGNFIHFMDSPGLLILKNNLILGPGQMIQGSVFVVDSIANLWLIDTASAKLKDPTNFDYHPLAGSPCIDGGVYSGSFNGFILTPSLQYQHPLSFEDRVVSGTSADIGAFEFIQDVSGVQQVLSMPNLRISPNPSLDGQLVLNFDAPLRQQSHLRVTDMVGNTVFEAIVPQGETSLSCSLPTCQPGLYMLDMEGFAKQRIMKL